MSGTDTQQTEQSIRYEPALHKGNDVIFIRFEYSRELNERVRKLVGVQWSRTDVF